jgi:hypothetical protein
MVKKLFSETLLDPNKGEIYFDTTTLNYTNKTIFKVVATTLLNNGGEKTIIKYYNLEGSSGVLHPDMAIMLSALIVLFTITLFAASRVFTIFGFVAILIAFLVLSMAPLTDIILFLYGMYSIVALYIGIIFISEYAQYIR